MTVRLALASLLVAGVTACTETMTEPLDPLDPYGDDDREPPPPPWLAMVDGSYYVRTQLTLERDVGPTHLREYLEEPGSVLVTAATTAGTPAATQLQASLPDATFAQLPALYQQALASNVTGLLGVYGLVLAVERTAPVVELEGQLVLAGTQASLTLETMYPNTTLEDGQPLGEADGDIVVATAPVQLEPTSTGGVVQLGPSELAIAAGEYGWRALASPSVGDVRAIVGSLTLCPLVGVTVAGACGAACSGSELALIALCEQGLDVIVEDTHQQVAAHVLELGGVSAVVIDGSGDQVADRLEGRWTGVAASFVARRNLAP